MRAGSAVCSMKDTPKPTSDGGRLHCVHEDWEKQRLSDDSKEERRRESERASR